MRFVVAVFISLVLFAATIVLVKRWKDHFFPPPPRHSVIWIR